MPPNRPLALSLTGSGHLLVYQLGACRSLLKHDKVELRHVVGASGGAIAATVVACLSSDRLDEYAARFIEKRGGGLELLREFLGRNDTKESTTTLHIATTRCADGQGQLFSFSAAAARRQTNRQTASLRRSFVSHPTHLSPVRCHLVVALFVPRTRRDCLGRWGGARGRRHCHTGSPDSTTLLGGSRRLQLSARDCVSRIRQLDGAAHQSGYPTTVVGLARSHGTARSGHSPVVGQSACLAQCRGFRIVRRAAGMVRTRATGCRRDVEGSSRREQAVEQASHVPLPGDFVENSVWSRSRFGVGV